MCLRLRRWTGRRGSHLRTSARRLCFIRKITLGFDLDHNLCLSRPQGQCIDAWAEDCPHARLYSLKRPPCTIINPSVNIGSSMDATCCRTDCMQLVFRPQTPPHVILANSVPTKMSLRKREHHQLTLTCTKTNLLLNSTINWCPYVIEIHDIFISTRQLAANQNAMARTCFGARSTYVTA